MKYVYQVTTVNFQPVGVSSHPGNLGFFSSRKAACDHYVSVITDRLHHKGSVEYLTGDVKFDDYPELVLRRANILSNGRLQERLSVIQYRVCTKGKTK